MCGFAGVWIDGSRSEGALRETTERMIGPIAHRGPDDEGVWTEPEAGVGLGFRRLAIIDLSEQGHQPMRSASGRFTLVFNGEVYNHGSIRQVLERDGWSFRGHSDTEVICAAFERWGIEPAVQKFVGMFAMAVWDAERRELSLIRDRLGIKPLFYSHRPGRVTFGSELKALTADPEFDRSVDGDALGAYLRYLYVPAPQTIYRSARKLMPGHILTLRSPRDPAPASSPYWSLSEAYRLGGASRFEGSDEEAVTELTTLLSDAVRLRMQADVPLGALLSGGIDSSTVVALMQANASRPTKTFSIGFDEAEHNEAHHAAAVARHLGTDHTELMMTGDDALSVVPQLPELFDEPLADPSQIPTYLVCGLARREVIVALSGDGGDELFAGYHRYLQGERLIGRLGRVPRPVRRAAAAVATAGSTAFWDRTYQAVAPLLPAAQRQRLPGEKVTKLGNLLRWDSEANMYRSLLSAWQNPEQLLAREGHLRGRVEEALDETQGLPLLDRMMLADQGTYLADDLLAKVDRASMAVSLEARVPILDHRVVEFSWRLPRSLKVRDGKGKWILRRVLYRYVDPQLVERPKMGFSVPVAAWLRGPLRGWAEDLLFAGGGQDEWLRQERVRHAWKEFLGGRSDLALPLWTVLMFQAWRARWTS